MKPSFEPDFPEVPQHSLWHTLTGAVVLTCASFGGVFAMAWLLA